MFLDWLVIYTLIRQLTTNPFPRVGREDIITEVIKNFESRWLFRKGSPIPDDNKTNPVITIHGPTGGGKSFALDEIAKLEDNDLSKCKTSEFQQILKNSIPITITYNGATNFTPGVDGVDLEGGLALRILFG